MRSMWWLALAGAALVVMNVRVTGGAAGKPKAPPRVVAQRAAEGGEVVDGYGLTAEKAREQALVRAQDRVEELLAERFGRSGWRPTPEQVDREYLARFEVIKEQGKAEPAPVEGERMVVARYRVALTKAYVGEVVREVRQQKVQERHLILARLLGGILAVALVLAGYLRLEEMTRGYATQLLRAAAVTVLALVGAGLWLTL